MGPCQFTERDGERNTREDSACEEPLHECDEDPVLFCPRLSPFLSCLLTPPPSLFLSSSTRHHLPLSDSGESKRALFCFVFSPPAPPPFAASWSLHRAEVLTVFACRPAERHSLRPTASLGGDVSGQRSRIGRRGRLLDWFLSSSCSQTVPPAVPEVHKVPTSIFT